MVGAIIAFTLQSGQMGWTSRYFEDVRLHRHGPVVTVQVAWQWVKPISTASEMPGVVSVFRGPFGRRKLLQSTNVGNLSWPTDDIELKTDKECGEALLFLPLSVGQRWHGGVYCFEGNRPHLLRESWGLSPDNLARGTLTESDEAKNVGFRIAPGDYPNPIVVRRLRFDSTKRDLVEGPWRVAVFNSPVEQTLRGMSRGHRYVVRLAKRNFRLDGRTVAFVPKRGLVVGGLDAFGQDIGSKEELEGRDPRMLFSTEFTTFHVTVDGVKWRVPERAWKGCFDPHIESAGVTVSKSGNTLSLEMSGSDGAGSYTMTWKLHPDGRYTRSYEGPP